MCPKPIICSLKSPQNLSIGDSEFNAGCCTIDATFPNMGTVNIGSIAFRNDYTAYLTLHCKVKLSKEGDVKTAWKLALKRMRLMANPHIESSAQSRFVINTSDFRCQLENVSLVRFVMMQPSPCWKSFGLQDMKFFPPETIQELALAVPRWLLPSSSLRIGADDESATIKDRVKKFGLPDPDEVSNKLHQLWKVTEISSDVGPATPIGRFDIDGCYEINLLSYAPAN